MTAEMTRPELGVCYYPEQWPEAQWADDARRMRELGLDWVRVGEFAWSMIEPAPGRFEWDWLDRAIDVLGAAGLKVIMSTPTAAPPRWLVDKHPEILPVGPDGNVRKFGSRRHYCFSSPVFRGEAARIAEAVAERYGTHEHVAAWQIDNEYGDHDTIHSYSPAARDAFRDWLARRYGDIGALNTAWGTSFWSMRYDDFAQIELPNQMVEEPTPTQLTDFLRFSSDQVQSFNRMQAEILRKHAPGRAITHNFMNQNEDFDHHAVGADLDVASWDAYPLGNLVHGRLPEADKQRLLRHGDPDQPGFNHDLYRGVGNGRMWVMEQQPGPVNWADANPAPADGMVRLWTWLAHAHGCEMVSYFRWRQAPFAQEQFHTGLLLPDSTPDRAFAEIEEVVAEAAALPALPPRAPSEVALVLDYPSRWALSALPQGRNFRAGHHALDWYSALRRLGIDVDIVGQHTELNGYRLVVAPDLVMADAGFIKRIAASDTKAIFGPRSGSRTEAMHVTAPLPGAGLAPLIELRVTRVESLPDWHSESFLMGNASHAARRWRETIESDAEVLATFEGAYREGTPALVGNDRARYLATLPGDEGLRHVLEDTLRWAGVDTLPDLGPDLRLTRRGNVTFAFNFGCEPAAAPAPPEATFHLGAARIPPAGVAAWSET
ncbi:putative beta-galactosidase protein [Oceanicola granulosus HTCC2516]|uniref:Beta-galactosidase n=1 Tax=Oceanicola granulosus (strain ATCC BAA-861 / DSM 15982 / KCTC 12143 / HTCC2516) TaxID=314256 RepID=Q2CGC8_OCEGH|nr:beta-galactosidase [Oceanicola granulosus]EAR51790.1 putative beta-galactosidase protein [Oceanicola granulosus HTCC2516]